MSIASKFVYAEKRNYLNVNNVEEQYSDMIRSMVSIMQDSKTHTIVHPDIIPFFSLDNFKREVLPLNVPSNVTVDRTSRSFFSSNVSREQRFEALKAANQGLRNYMIALNEKQQISVKDDVVHVMDSLMFKTAHNVIQFFVLTSILYVMLYMDSALFGDDKKVTFNNQLISEYDVADDIKFINNDFISVKVINQTSLLRDLYAIFQEMNVRNELYLAHVPGNIQKNKNIMTQQNYIDNKEDEFNRRKSYVITMVNKNHRVRDTYDRKYFWTMIYFFALVFMIIAFIALEFLFRASSLETRMFGMLLLAVSAGSLSLMIVIRLYRWLYK